ncbi:MAG TPA: PorT family protein [Candidatus Avelusimicrobium excrementipullorum]|nr:PorT family protein [Candidatus Avelusimicrobium excrementipullorum]
MKKVICLLAVLLAASGLPAQENKNLLSVGVGAAVPMGSVADSVFTDVDTGDIKWGKTGGNVEFQYLHFVNERWAFGMELGAAILTSEEHSFSDSLYIPGYNPPHVTAEGKLKSKTYSINAMLAGRLHLNPAGKMRFYIPFGAGLSYAELSLSGHVAFKEAPFKYNGSVEYSDAGPAGYIGLGMELKRTETDLVSLEARYHMARLKEQEVSATYKYVTVMLKVGGLF